MQLNADAKKAANNAKEAALKGGSAPESGKDSTGNEVKLRT